MKLTFPKITQPIDLVDYAPEMVQDDGTPALVYVWVNPPAALMNAHAALRARAQVAMKKVKDAEASQDEAATLAVVRELADVGTALFDVFAQLWSARSDEATHWTAEEVKELANNVENPALYSWITSRTIAAINEYRGGIRKN